METTAPATPVYFVEIETTDTMGGEANYCWCNRALACVPADRPHLANRLIRAAAGLTGIRTRRSDYGGMIRYDHVGACVVTFATDCY